MPEPPAPEYANTPGTPPPGGGTNPPYDSSPPYDSDTFDTGSFPAVSFDTNPPGPATPPPSRSRRSSTGTPVRGTPIPGAYGPEPVPEGPASRPVQELRPDRRAGGGNTGPMRRPQGGRGGGRPDLPRRVRQANLAPQLREEAAASNETRTDQQSAPRAERSPEELRSMMSSIQRGTKRGRTESTIEFDEGS